MRVLLIEDDRNMASLLSQGLNEDGYNVVECLEGAEGYAIASSSHFDLIVLDVMLPGMDGYEIARRLRAERVATPILMLTARDTHEDIIKGLNVGADDYITKPFDFGVFLARVRAAIRRGPASALPTMSAGPLEIDVTSREVFVAGKPVTLSRTEFAILELLMRRKGHVVTREVILEEVWGWDRTVESNTLDAFIRLLRSKIDRDPAHSSIRTVRGVGYTLDAGGR